MIQSPLQRILFNVVIAVAMTVCSVAVHAHFVDPEWNGAKIMEESDNRHQQFPFIYEEQTMVLIDSAGHRNVRRLRRYTRLEDDGEVKFLLVFDDPDEIRGVALVAVRAPGGNVRHGVYLPAFGPNMKVPEQTGIGDHFLGTDFAIEDLTPETLADYRYVRQRDRIIEGTEYFVVDAYPNKKTSGVRTGYGLRRHIIRKDNFMVVQTDVYDAALRFFKRVTHHDLRRVDGESWRANMIIANDRRETHRTLLKVDRRVYSQDYVPAQLFEVDFLTSNRHVVNAAIGEAPVEQSEAERQLMQQADDS